MLMLQLQLGRRSAGTAARTRSVFQAAVVGTKKAVHVSADCGEGTRSTGHWSKGQQHHCPCPAPQHQHLVAEAEADTQPESQRAQGSEGQDKPVSKDTGAAARAAGWRAGRAA